MDEQKIDAADVGDFGNVINENQRLLALVAVEIESIATANGFLSPPSFMEGADITIFPIIKLTDERQYACNVVITSEEIIDNGEAVVQVAKIKAARACKIIAEEIAKNSVV